jgi:hypothetical protein
MQEIRFSLTIDEVNLILEGLGTMPFTKVYALIGKIQEQAAQQIKAANAVNSPAAEAGARPGEQEPR